MTGKSLPDKNHTPEGAMSSEQIVPAAQPFANTAQGKPLKTKQRLWPARILCICTVVAITAAFCASMYNLFQKSKESQTSYFDQRGFAMDIVEAAYTLNWRLEKTIQNNPELTPTELYYPVLARLVDKV